ncbi:hypothetical protein VCRA2122O340_10240 [Vibrio crassostreae]|nr:hypothetical protein VCRA2122O340_10240 [Vibrio crassostreae]CAK3778574.1 hypothetical protein VCRA2121O335_10240 [Vibrio crassostreae]CAK3815075.1 hypothetical protein VCRA2128O346_10240 [Vibrio crassostreae]
MLNTVRSHQPSVACTENAMAFKTSKKAKIKVGKVLMIVLILRDKNRPLYATNQQTNARATNFRRKKTGIHAR